MSYVWKFEQLVQDYHDQYATMSFDRGFEATIKTNANRILKGRARYEAVAEAIHEKFGGSIPWYFIGIIHQMEGSCNFKTHLHNGDPLSAKTVQVPENRPPHPPESGGKAYSWEESAIDALTMPGKVLHKVQIWSVERMAYQWELYNGTGYLSYHPKDKSPYLWAQTSVNDGKGKYKYDGVWVDSLDANGQSGTMALLRQLTEQLGLTFPEEPLLNSAPDMTKDKKTVEAIQRQLVAIGFPTGQIDGIWASRGLTAQAIASSKVANHWEPADGSITAEYLAALMTWGHQDLSDVRQNLTAKDLKDQGSTTIAVTDMIKKGSITAGAVATVSEAAKSTGLTDMIPDAGDIQHKISTVTEWQAIGYSISGLVKSVLKFAQDNTLILVVAAVVVVYFAMKKIEKTRVDKARNGLDVSI